MMQLPHINTEGAIERLRQTGTFLLDLDGTVYLGGTLLPGSPRFFQVLRHFGKQFIFVTNNSSRHGRAYARKITGMGIEVDEDAVFTSGDATIHFLKGRGFAPQVRVFGTSELETQFAAAGFNIADPNPSAVVLGFDLMLTYDRLRELCDLVRRGIPFIATHPDFNCPTPAGPIPDCGAIIAAVTAATGVAPRVIGKPNATMVEALCARYDLNPHAIAMVGDRLYTDIAMGRAAGIPSILVLSGETTIGDLDGSPHVPDIVARDLGELADMLESRAIGRGLVDKPPGGAHNEIS